MLQSYRPISLLPICRKVFERLLCNKIFEFFMNSELISQGRSGFTSGNFCVKQIEGSQDSLS